MRIAKYQKSEEPPPTGKGAVAPDNILLFRGDSLNTPPRFAFPFSARICHLHPEEPKRRAGRARATSLTCSSGAGHNEARRLAEPLRHAGGGGSFPEKREAGGSLPGLRGWEGRTSPRFPPTSPPSFRLAQAPLSRPPSEEGDPVEERGGSPSATAFSGGLGLAPFF